MLRCSGNGFTSAAAVPGGVVASEPLESVSKAPAAEVAASSCLRRAASCLLSEYFDHHGKKRRIEAAK